MTFKHKTFGKVKLVPNRSCDINSGYINYVFPGSYVIQTCSIEDSELPLDDEIMKLYKYKS